jgi:hypothetical protein
MNKFAVAVLLGLAHYEVRAQEEECRGDRLRYQGRCVNYNPYWADDLMEMQNGRYHFENLTNMAEQRVMQLQQQLEDRRNGGRRGGDSSSDDERVSDGPTPEGAW